MGILGKSLFWALQDLCHQACLKTQIGPGPLRIFCIVCRPSLSPTPHGLAACTMGVQIFWGGFYAPARGRKMASYSATQNPTDS